MKERSAKDLWKICWKITRVFFNQINIRGGNMNYKTLGSIIHMRRCYDYFLNEESNDMFNKARRVYFSREWAKENAKDKKGD
jgi:hypothetical protein